MSLENAVNFILKNNEAVIQWLVVATIGLVALLVARAVFGKKSSSASRSQNISSGATAEQIEGILAKVLEKTKSWESDKSASPSTGQSGVNPAELEKAKKELGDLKAALQTREAEINKLKTEVASKPASGGGGAEAPSGDNSAYLARIEELEAKLSEYAVLEDDIADLSLYKEENSRLKSELDRLRGGVAVDESTMATPEPEPSEDLVKEFAEAVGKEPKLEEEESAEDVFAAAALETPADPIQEPIAEVSAPPAEPVVEPVLEAKVEAQVEEATVEAPKVEAPNPQGEVDDLFAELASGNLDTDRVVSELADIAALDSKATAEEAFGEGVDPDKILAESGGQPS